jgi:hypothetical protein
MNSGKLQRSKQKKNAKSERPCPSAFGAPDQKQMQSQCNSARTDQLFKV